MTASPAHHEGPPGQAQRAWLFGPVPDLLLGCGGLYLLLLPILNGFGTGLVTAPPQALAPLLVLSFSIPHYGATLVRVYERSRDRRTYAVFSVWATLALLLAFGVSLYHFAFACWMVTLYLTWSTWHYTGQNFGIAVMFLRRAQVPFGDGIRRLLHTAFTLSFVLAAVTAHSSYGTAIDYPVDTSFVGQIRFLPVGIPPSVSGIVVPVLGIGLVVTTLLSIGVLLRRTTLRKLVPLLMLFLAQTLWFSLPYGLAHFHLLTHVPSIDLDFRLGAFTYIAISHAIQYLWVTSYYAKSSDGWKGFGRYGLKALLFGQSIAAFPILIVGLTPLGGNLSYDSGLLLLVVTFVNLHHFVLDGAIWKLRGGAVARILLRSERDEAEAPSQGIGRRIGWSLAGVALAIGVVGYVDRWLIFPRAVEQGQVARAEASLDRLAWFGEDSAGLRVHIARLHASKGNVDRAEAAARRSLELRPLPEAYQVLGDLRVREGDWTAARAFYEEGLGEWSGSTSLRRSAGIAAFRLADWTTARDHLRRVVAERPNDREAVRLLDEAFRRIQQEQQQGREP